MRIYIHGDIGMPTRLNIVDADTGKKLDQIESMTIEIDPYNVVATMRMTTGPNQTAAVVPAPTPKSPEVTVPLKKPTRCPECQGTGEWENPLTGKSSPCKAGCPPAAVAAAINKALKP